MKKIRTLSLKWSGAIAALALVVATLSTSITCGFTAYQPELPEQLKQ